MPEKIFKEIGKSKSAFRCRAKLHEKYLEWQEAAEYWKISGKQKNEINALLKYHESNSEFELAAILAERHHYWENASDYYKQAELLEKSKFCEGKNYEMLELYNEADQIYSQIGKWSDRIEMWTKLGKYETVAQLYEDRIKMDSDEDEYYRKAAEAWELSGQLENAIERALILCENNTIMPGDLPRSVFQEAYDPISEGGDEILTLEEIENKYIKKILKFTGNNKLKTAKLLRIDPKTLYRKLKRF